MKERVEDLGRLYVLLCQLSDHDLFQILGSGRTKDFPEYFQSLDSEKQYDMLYKIGYGIQNVSLLISDMIEIASGEDILNSPS